MSARELAALVAPVKGVSAGLLRLSSWHIRCLRTNLKAGTTQPTIPNRAHNQHVADHITHVVLALEHPLRGAGRVTTNPPDPLP